MKGATVNEPIDPEVPPAEPDGNAQHRRPSYEAAGGEDSSPFEGVPSGEKLDAARQPQNADPEGERR